MCASCCMPSCHQSITSANNLSPTEPNTQFINECKSWDDEVHHWHPLRPCAQSCVRELHPGKASSKENNSVNWIGIKWKQTTWPICWYSYPIIRTPVWHEFLRVFSCTKPYWAPSLLAWKTQKKWWTCWLTSETLSFISIRWDNLYKSPSSWQMNLTFWHFFWRCSVCLADPENGQRRGWGAAHAHPCDSKTGRELWGSGGSTPDSGAASVLWAWRVPLPQDSGQERRARCRMTDKCQTLTVFGHMSKMNHMLPCFTMALIYFSVKNYLLFVTIYI